MTAGPTETQERFRWCTSCQSSHLAPVPCGLTYRRRLLSVRIDPAVLETRNRANYYDQAALDDQFGPDAEEQMYEATDGLGAGYRNDRGEHVRRDRHTGEEVLMTPAEAQRIIDHHSEDLGELEPGETPESWEEAQA